MAAPKHQRIAAQLRAAILDGRYEPGTKLPSEAELGAQAGVSRITVRAALAALVTEGLITTSPGVGTFVRERFVLDFHAASAERADRPKKGDADAFFDEVRNAGRKPSQEFSMRLEPATAEVAIRLQVAEGDIVCVRRCYRFVDDQPWSDQHSYYPMDVAEQAGLNTSGDIAEGTVRAMARVGHIEIGYIDEVTSRVPTAVETQTLDVSAGTPVLVYTRTAWTDSRPVRLTQTVYPADRNRIIYELGDLRGHDEQNDVA